MPLAALPPFVANLCAALVQAAHVGMSLLSIGQYWPAFVAFAVLFGAWRASA